MLSRLNIFKSNDYVRHVNLQRNNIFRSGARGESVDLFKNNTKSVIYKMFRHQFQNTAFQI